jgi:hypothetical protein
MACGVSGATRGGICFVGAVAALAAFVSPASSQVSTLSQVRPSAPIIAQVMGRDVELGQVVDLSKAPGPVRARAAKLVVARFRTDQFAMAVDGRQVNERAAAMMPAVSGFLPKDPPRIERLIRAGPAMRPSPANCLKVVDPIAANAIPSQEDFVASDCDGLVHDRPLRYEAGSGFVRTLRTLAPGEVIGGLPASAMPAIGRGRRLYIEARVGLVIVQREVNSAQPARAGEPLFVADRNGLVFAAPALQDKP